MKRIVKIILLACIALFVLSCADKEPYIAMVSKGFQHKFWVTVKNGAEDAAKEYGVKINFVGPETESDTKVQQDLLDSEINKNPDAIAFAAITGDFSQQIKRIKDKNIPLVAFDSGIQKEQQQGVLLATASTDNRAAAAIVGEKMFVALKDRIAKFTAENKAIIGVIQQDNSGSAIDRSGGFVDKFTELANSDPNTKGKFKIVVKVPSTQNESDIQLEVSGFKGNAVLGIYNTNEAGVKGTVLVYTNNKPGAPGTIVGDAQDGGDIIICGFDSGKPQLDAMRNGVFYGSVTQNPYMIGYKAVELAVLASRGETVSDVDTGAKWYTKETMDDEDITPLLYE